MKLLDPIRTVSMALLVFALTAPFARAKDAQLPQLMHLLAQDKSAKATFVERTYIGIIDRPLVSTGDLSFAAPDSLEKRTLTPKPELLVLRGNTLKIERPGKRLMTIGLEGHPEISAFIESIRGTLAGDLTALKALYSLRLTGPIGNWRLVLTPKQRRLSRIFSRIRIGGSDAVVRTIELDQRDGDHSIMVITPVSRRQ
ncbi:MAG: outer membrane lipoprotein carrier protein LolA [Gammaproteobacteria bacterium]|nr:outer membrane lipoprotein carrier protein LolA [Gammaproteobacteria bacterium]